MALPDIDVVMVYNPQGRTEHSDLIPDCMES
jgi:hypothetical protein